MNNPLLSVDSYKLSHPTQYPPDSEYIYAYGCPRKGPSEIPILGFRDAVSKLNCGLNPRNVAELQVLATAHGVPFFQEGWNALLSKYGDSGQFPITLKGVPEGTVVKPGTPVFSVVNSDPEFPWLTSFFETLILRCVWYPSTVAAISRECKKVIKKAMEESCDTLDGLEFKLHDFGARGVSSGESAALGGMGHLLNFQGTDTIEAIKRVQELYHEPMAGFSIPATEHSTVTSWGPEGESDMYEAYIRNNGGEGKVFACVSDSYHIWEALNKWKDLEPVLLETGGTLVIRPDSGDPVQTPVQVTKRLLDLFGYTVNSKGYKVLPDHIRVIQGDGINLESLKSIVFHLLQEKISIDNIAFGMGGGLLQQVNRDTYGWAMKTSAARVNGEWREVYKDPIGGKKSEGGFVTAEGKLALCDESIRASFAETGFYTYYAGGVCRSTPLGVETWADIRKRAEV